MTSNEHEELHPLTERLKTVLAWRAPSTVISYLRPMYKWKSFATRYNFCYFPAEPTAVALYLQHIIETTKNITIIAIDRHISYSTFREHLKSDLFGIGDDPSEFGSHSLRSGGATQAANAGIEEHLSQRHGRWRPVPSKNMYMDDVLSKKLGVSNVIQS